MSATTSGLISLTAYALGLLWIGWKTRSHTRDSADFYLGGRTLGGTVAALSSLASSSSAWTLLGISSLAYATGFAAIWLLPGTLLGLVLNWYLIAPRLRRLARSEGWITLTDVLVAGSAPRSRRALAASASAITVVSFLFYVAAQLTAAGVTFAQAFALDPALGMSAGAAIVLIYTLLGGFWAVSLTDTVQGLLMALVALILPGMALLAIGGPAALWHGMVHTHLAGFAHLTGAHAGWAGLGFVLGTFGIGIGWTGQPHVLNRYMALADDGALRRGRAVAWSWTLVTYSGMLLLGWCGRVLLGPLDPGDGVFFAVGRAVLPAAAAGVLVAAVLSAVMSTADSQLLVASSCLGYDLRRQPEHDPGGVLGHRLWVATLTLVALLIAIGLPATIFSRVLFAWHALAAAFGPLLLARILGRRCASGYALAAMWAGFAGTVWLHWQPDTPGDIAERLLPYAVAAILVIAGVANGVTSRPHSPAARD